jgi:hypothetical protein
LLDIRPGRNDTVPVTRLVKGHHRDGDERGDLVAGALTKRGRRRRVPETLLSLCRHGPDA